MAEDLVGEGQDFRQNRHNNPNNNPNNNRRDRFEISKVLERLVERRHRFRVFLLAGQEASRLESAKVMVRQERIGLHMADAISRVTSARKLGAFCMQHGPGAENAYGGVAQAYGESVPVLVVPLFLIAETSGVREW